MIKPGKISLHVWVLGSVTFFCLVAVFGVDDSFYKASSFKDFKGNLISGYLTSLVFYLIALYLNRGMERAVTQIKNQVSEMNEIHQNWKQERDAEWEMKRFDTFMYKEHQHNIRIRNTPYEFQIVPQRDKDGIPVNYGAENQTVYLVKLTGPAYADSLSRERLAIYSKSGFKTNEYYFCQFRNWSWHISLQSGGGEWHPFYLSSKSYGFSFMPTANQFAEAQKSFEKMTPILELNITVDGEDPNDALMHSPDGVSVYTFSLYCDDRAQTWLKTADAPPQKTYFSNSEQDPMHWHLVIENFENYLSDEILLKFKNMVARRAEQNNVVIPKVEWWHFER